MGEYQRKVVTVFGDEAVSQPPDARTGVDDDDAVIPGADLDTGGVPTVAQIPPSSGPAYPYSSFLLRI
jgi:hypothetical protein